MVISMKQEQFMQEQVKNIFKVSKQLHSTFRGIKKLTMKYLIKITKLKAKKKAADAQRQVMKKKQQMQRRKKLKMQEKKQQKLLQNKGNTNQSNNHNSESHPQHKSIISIINDNKPKLKSNRPRQKNQQNQQKETGEKKQKTQAQSSEQQKQKPSEKKKTDKPKKSQKASSKQVSQPIKSIKILQKPIEPESPYYRFLRMKKNEIRSSMSNIPMEKTSQIMKSIWDKMRDEQKKQYIQSYEMDKAKYERDTVAYFNQQNMKNVSKANEKEIDNNMQKSFTDFDFIDQLDKM